MEPGASKLTSCVSAPVNVIPGYPVISSQRYVWIPLAGPVLLSGSYEKLPSSVTSSPSNTLTSSPASATGGWFMVITTVSEYSTLSLSIIVNLNVSSTRVEPETSGASKLALALSGSIISTAGRPSVCSHLYDLIWP